ncbi:MAG: hypothetical protein PHZ26_03090 [Candidatus Gracilibacteria bacterium]|nr:hypothetical protein [Candidatus Gracilibacteria bacterium]MDD2908713.1 hypothetical protein [Candidatus Gracilibacteria bacterium]
MKEQVRQILLEKQGSNTVANNMLEFIDFFTESELLDIHNLLSIKDIKARKEILTKHIAEYEQTIDEIIKIGMQFERLKTIMMYEGIRKQSSESLANLKASLSLNPNT